MSNAFHPLEGCGFLSFQAGKCREQGVVVSAFDTGMRTFVVLQFMEWMGGDETYRRIIDLEDLVFDDNGDPDKKTYRIFQNNDDRNAYYEWKGGKFEGGAR